MIVLKLILIYCCYIIKMRSMLLLSTLSLDVFQVKHIIYPYLNQSIDTIYDGGTNHSYIIYTKSNITNVVHMPILLYRPPHYIIITHPPIQFTPSHEWNYKKDMIVWYNHKEQIVKLWSKINKIWYKSCDYPYRKTTF
jgi:hypothetical protein